MIKTFLILLPVLLCHLLILSLLTFTAWPEMLSYPYLLSNGFQIYSDVVIPYPPLLPLTLMTVFSIFGFEPQVLKWFSWMLIIIVDVNLFLLVRMISKSQKTAIFLLSVFVILQSFLDGNMLWFDFATVVMLSFGLIFFWKWINQKKLQYLVLTVLFLALGTAIKQTAAIYFLPVIVGYLFTRKRIVLKELIYSATAFLVVWLPIIGYLFINNLIQSFWNWNFVYPLTEWSKFPGYVDLVLSRRQLIIMFLLFLPIGVTVIKFKSLEKNFWILFSLLICALVAVYPRFSFFHLQPALFCLVVLVTYLSTLLKSKKRLILLGVTIICTLLIVYFQFTAAYSPLTIRFAQPNDIYLAEQIKSLTPDDKKVYLLGPASSQYVFSQTLPSKPWMDTFGWYLEIPRVQDQVIAGLKTERPEVILWQQPQSGQWYELGVYQPDKIVSFIQQSYIQSKVLENGVTVWTRKN